MILARVEESLEASYGAIAETSAWANCVVGEGWGNFLGIHAGIRLQGK